MKLNQKVMYYAIDNYKPNKLKVPILLDDHKFVHELAKKHPDVIVEAEWIHDRIVGVLEALGFAHKTELKSLISSPPWGSIAHNKTNHPNPNDFIIRGVAWSDNKLPFRYKGKIHCGGVRAAIAAVGGARSGKSMHLTPAEKARLNAAVRACGIGNALSENNPPPLKDANANLASSFFREGHKMEMSFSAPFSGPGKDVEGGYLIENQCLLGVGAWKGSAMPHAIWHSPEYLQKVLRLMQEKTPLCVEHSCYPGGIFDPTKAYGFIFNQRTDPNGDLMGDIMVKNPDVIRLVKTGHFKGVSFNAQAIVCPERRYAMEPTSIMESSFVINPACKVSYFPGFNN